MRVNLFRAVAGALSIAMTLALSGIAWSQTGTPPSANQTPASGQGQRGRGFGGFPGGGRGVLGTVTEATADHYTIKTDSGEIYTVHFSVNTRIMKQPAGRTPGQGRGAGQGAGQNSGQNGGQAAATGTGSGSDQTPGRRRSSGGDNGEEGGNRPMPQTIKPSEIHVGDIITAGGEMDSASKSIGAVFIAVVDPERAKQMREMQANYGKTWLAGKITGIKETTITIDGMIDHAPHAIVVDENTSFRQRRDSITLADIQPGEQLRAEGAIKDGVFVATTVVAMQPQNREGGPSPD